MSESSKPNPERVAPVASAVPLAVPRAYPLWLGGVAATIAASITHPLDLTKVRLQTGEEKGMLASMRRTVRLHGFRGLYDGLTGTLLRQMTYSMARFAAYDSIKAALHVGPGPPPGWKMAAAGSLAGGIAGILGNPAELIMVRMMADKARWGYTNSVRALYTMTRSEGVGAWFRGVAPNTIRSVLMNASQLGSYDFFKHELLAAGMVDSPVTHLIASLGAGTLATTVCSPADVIKARVMSAAGNDSMIGVFRSSLQNEGPGFMFKGWLPAWTRLQPQTILIFLILEQLKSGVDKYRAMGGTMF